MEALFRITRVHLIVPMGSKFKISVQATHEQVMYVLNYNFTTPFIVFSVTCTIMSLTLF